MTVEAMGGSVMQYRGSIATIALTAAALCMPIAAAQAFDDAIYPAMTGRWARVAVPGEAGLPPFDPGKPPGRGQQAPLTSEYQAKFETALAERAALGLGDVVSTSCLAPGMPMMMQAYEPMQITVLPETTYILIDYIHESHRRIFTDGREWPKTITPTFTGYSVGRWIDEDGDGRYDVLEAETRAFKGPRVFDSSGIPLHDDNESVVKERIYLDKADRNLLHDEITVTDHALTRPWTVVKSYKREPNPIWYQNDCSEDNRHVFLGMEHYVISADDLLMPAKKDQAPPDLRYFKQTRK